MRTAGLCARWSGCSRSRGWATGVDADGELAEASMQRVETCVARYADRARELGASTPLAVATSAVRDAANGAEFMRRCWSSAAVCAPGC